MAKWLNKLKQKIPDFLRYVGVKTIKKLRIVKYRKVD